MNPVYHRVEKDTLGVVGSLGPELPRVLESGKTSLSVPEKASLILPEGEVRPDEKINCMPFPRGQNIAFVGLESLDALRYAFGWLNELAGHNQMRVLAPGRQLGLDLEVSAIGSYIKDFKPDVVFLPSCADASTDAVKLRGAVFDALKGRSDVRVVFYPVNSSVVKGVNLTYAYDDPSLLKKGFEANESQTRVRFDDSIVDNGERISLLLGGAEKTGGRFVHPFTVSVYENGLERAVDVPLFLTAADYKQKFERLLGRKLGKRSVVLSASPHADDGLLWAGMMGRQMALDGITFIDMVATAGHRAVPDAFLLQKSLTTTGASDEVRIQVKKDVRNRELQASGDVMGWGKGNTMFLDLPMYGTKDAPTREDEQKLAGGVEAARNRGDLSIVIAPPVDDSHRDHHRTALLIEPLLKEMSIESPIVVLRGWGPWVEPVNAYFVSLRQPELPEKDRQIYMLQRFRTPPLSEVIYAGEPGFNIPERILWRGSGQRPPVEAFLISSFDNALRMHEAALK